MTEEDKVLSVVQQHKGKISGTIQMFGDWFGRPYDNIHRLQEVSLSGNVLLMAFVGGEILEVTAPSGAKIDNKIFSIDRASRVLWKWFYYGKPQVDSNLYYYDYQVRDGAVLADTNVDWYEPDLKPSLSSSAVRIHIS
jgi:hypothetical protein